MKWFIYLSKEIRHGWKTSSAQRHENKIIISHIQLIKEPINLMMVLIFILWKHAVYNGKISSITWYKQLLDENCIYVWYSILHKSNKLCHMLTCYTRKALSLTIVIRMKLTCHFWLGILNRIFGLAFLNLYKNFT